MDLALLSLPTKMKIILLSIVLCFLLDCSYCLEADQRPIRHVLIAVAMEAEAMPFVEHLALKRKEDFFESHLPFEAYTGPFHDDGQITLITNGKDSVYETGVDNVGTVPAALATYLALHKLEGAVDLLINAGTCGGFDRKGARIGDVFLTTAVTHHDRRIPIPGFSAYGIGKLAAADIESNSGGPSVILDPQSLATSLNFKLGIVSTGNSLDKTEQCDRHMLANDASVKDMEAAAIAWSCSLLKTPFLGVKVVTDIVDGNLATAEEFLANLDKASKSLQQALPQLLEAVMGKTISDLIR